MYKNLLYKKINKIKFKNSKKKNVDVHMNDLGDLVQNADSDSVGLGWNPRLCISNKYPGEANSPYLS